MANEEKQVNKSQFLKSLNANKAAAKAAAKEKRPEGSLNDQEILRRLGLEAEGQMVTLPAAVSKIAPGFAKKDTSRPFFRFAYSLTENSPLSQRGKGMLISTYHELTEGKRSDGEVWRTVEAAYENLFFEFQGIGEDTESWSDPLSDALEAAERHTKEKTEIMLVLSAYAKKDKNELGLNIRPEPMTNNDDLEEVEEETEEEEYEEVEGDEGEESEGDEDETPPEDWVGYWYTWADESGPENAATVKLTEWHEESQMYSGIDDEGNEYTEEIPQDQLEYLDPQPEE